MYCCPECFNHRFLKNHIKTYSVKIGKCSFCLSTDQPLYEPLKLIDLFQPVLDLYEPSSTGEFFSAKLQYDWQIFSEKLTQRKTKKIISHIYSDNSLSKLLVESPLSYGESILENWNEFKLELQHENRFFPRKALNIIQIQDLLDYLVLEKERIPTFLYRSRINMESHRFSIEEMGKPPVEKAPDGRANPKGISYFYGASDQATSIAEVRPYKSEIVSVGKFRLKKSIALIDLRNPRKTISPFEFDDDGLILLFEEHMPFLSHLGTSLSIPVLPHKKDLEYLPTQYLCELIKDRGFDGIIFKSSLGIGDNYVIFDDSVLTGKKVDYFRNEEIIHNPVKMKL